MLSDILRYLDRKSSERQNNTAEKYLKNTIVIDSGSSINLFKNSKLVTDIKRIDQVFHISKNVLYKINQMKEMILDYGKVWYDDKAIANIFSFTNFINKYRVIYDSHKDDAFVVHTNRGIIKSRRKKQGIYVFNYTYTTANSNVFTTVEEIMVGFTSR